MNAVSSESSEGRVPLAKKIAYGAPAFALAVVGIPVYVYIPKFYTDVVGIPVAVVGALLFGVRIFDAFTDPLIGLLSDRTRTRFGRRRPYIAVGSVLVAAALVFLFVPPQSLGTAAATVWFAVCIFALFFFWSVVVVPFESMGPEISLDYNERTALFGVRDGLLIAGTLAAASSPALVQALFGLSDSPAGERAKFFWISVLYAPLVVGACLWCVFQIRERFFTPTFSGLFSGFKDVWQNQPFVILLAAYTIAAVGSNLPATLILFYVQYVIRSDAADFFLLLYFVTGILFLPAWVRLSSRIGKKNAWIGSMAVNTGAFTGVFFLGPGHAVPYGLLVFLSGIGFGATLALPSSIQADVIDYDELRTGYRQEGRYIGLWSIAKKAAAAVGVGAGLLFLGAAGYTPNAVQNDSVVFTLRVLYALVPSVCNLIGLLVVLKYPISASVHEQIRSAIQSRGEGNTACDPLHPQRCFVGPASI